jgi:hypothetical protein
MKYTWKKSSTLLAALDSRTSASWADGAAATDGGRRRSDDPPLGAFLM